MLSWGWAYIEDYSSKASWSIGVSRYFLEFFIEISISSPDSSEIPYLFLECYLDYAKFRRVKFSINILGTAFAFEYFLKASFYYFFKAANS